MAELTVTDSQKPCARFPFPAAFTRFTRLKVIIVEIALALLVCFALIGGKK